MARIGQALVILQKNSRYFMKSTRSPAFSLKIFSEKALKLFPNQPAVQSPSFRKICKGTLMFT
jgi:hypothetical protein